MKTTFIVGSIAQKALFDHEIKEQLSDGMWEDAGPMYQWRPWVNAEVVVAQEGQRVGRNFEAKSDYDLTQLMQDDIARARMIIAVKIVLTFDEPQYKVIRSLYDSIGNWLGLADYNPYCGVTDEEDAIRSQVLKWFPTEERLNMVKSAIEIQIYSPQELMADLKDLRDAMQVVSL
jgi:hypothetical protein